MKDSLAKKIKSRKAVVGIIGLGYVGLPLAHSFAAAGYKVFGIDLDAGKAAAIRRGVSYIGDLTSKELSAVTRRGRLEAGTDFSKLAVCDAVIVCVPTPLNRFKDPDISFIVGAMDQVANFLHSGQLIVLESTTYPGTTEEVLLPAFEKKGLKAGRDFFLCFSPERIDPGNEKFKTRDIPKVVGGVTPACTRLAAALYGAITPKVIEVSSSRTAEMTKLLENTFRIVNIGLINELAMAAKALKVDIWEAVDAAKTKPFGYMPFYPGPGIGGHCIGVDPIYLSWKARLHGSDLHFIELARRQNAAMPQYVVSQAVYALNQYRGKAIGRSKVLVLGVTYKKDVSDTRESPALDVLERLKQLGAEVRYHDPYVPRLKHETLDLKSVPLTPAVLRGQDLVILATNHSKFPYRMIARESRLIYDTRNAFKAISSLKIVRL